MALLWPRGQLMMLTGKQQHHWSCCAAVAVLEMVFLHHPSPNPVFKEMQVV